MSVVHPEWVVPGGTVVLRSPSFSTGGDGPPQVRLGDQPVHVSHAGPSGVGIVVPSTAAAGPQALESSGGLPLGTVMVARRFADGLHQVDNPAFDGLGRLFVTESGLRGTQSKVPLYRLDADGTRTAIAVELPNPTSLAMGPDGAMYVSSRFEGQIYRLLPDDRVELYASDLGVPTGLAFSKDGSLFVGDRSGSILRVRSTREVDVFASLPSSIAAFHLAFGPDDCLYVSAPTLASHDPIYRISPDRLVDTLIDGFGRPQGLAFDSEGLLYVVDALAGSAGLYRLDVTRPEPMLVASAPQLIGVAFDPAGGVVLASNDTAWRLDVPVRPLPAPFAVS